MPQRLDSPTALTPSLRRRLLLFLLLPMMVLMLGDAMLTYAVARGYANRVHDRDLCTDTLALAKLLQTQHLEGQLSSQLRFMLEYDSSSNAYYSIVSRKYGLLSGNIQFAQTEPPMIGAAPHLFDTHLGKRPLRAASVSIVSPRDAEDVLTVTEAESLHGRHQRAREILLLTIPMQGFLILSALSLVWFGVNHGLRMLEPLTLRLATRERGLAPITDADVPREILPLTRTIDALFSRLRTAMEVQERFIADAAHQLRTPLTGLTLHVERALNDSDPSHVQRDALLHIRKLLSRTTRTAQQLLALSRAQSPLASAQDMTGLDLTRLVISTVTLRVHEAIRAGIDLGYRGPDQTIVITGDAPSLQELIDNLIDNAMRYAGRDSTVTVGLAICPHGRVELSVEDDGPGVPETLLPRLGERFFRAPGSGENGTGLGLAIVQRIAERHYGHVNYVHGSQGGLRVAVSLPIPASHS